MKNIQSLISGICPVCDSTDVYSNTELPQRGESRQIVVSSFMNLYLKNYICLSCGFTEDHVSSEQLKNEKLIKEIRSTWKKIKKENNLNFKEPK